MNDTTTATRPPAVAGQFYPADALELRHQVEDMLSRARDAKLAGPIRGLVAPHAGYPFSGQTAAAAYRQIRGLPFETVVILAPSHKERCGISVFPGEAYDTPLGSVQVDGKSARAIASSSPVIDLSEIGHCVAKTEGFPLGPQGEHAIEVHLPFLQVALGDFKIIPIVLGTVTVDECRILADAIVDATDGGNTLLIASTDLYHGHHYEQCVERDRFTLREVAQLKPEQLARNLTSGLAQACGGHPITTLLMAATTLGATNVEILERTNSAEVGGGSDYVVGYGAAAIYADPSISSFELSEIEKACLGEIARDAVKEAISGGDPPPIRHDLPNLRQLGRAFVTIYCNGDLRGCIGNTHGREPLDRTVQKMAAAAATRDPRFTPLCDREHSTLSMEISVIGRMREITTPSDIQVGRHGIWIKRELHQGLLLPQVTTRNQWDHQEILENVCKKAGLPTNAWHHPETHLYVFTAEVFKA